MNYSEIVKDLNSDIYDGYGDEHIQNGFKYTYQTDGGIDTIKFAGIKIWENDFSTEETDDLSVIEFEDWLEDKVFQIGNAFLSLSFHA